MAFFHKSRIMSPPYHYDGLKKILILVVYLPGPLDPPAKSRPRRNMTARSYS